MNGKIYSAAPPNLIRPDDGTDTDARPTDSCLNSLPPAMAYIPMQDWKNIYGDGKSLIRGTVFQELDLPFEGARI